MQSFELADNLFQVLALGCDAVAAVVLALRRRNRRFLILALAYACFAMGTLYYVLHLAVVGTVPQIFYVAEVSWLAAYLFFLSLQILRTEALPLRFSWLPGLTMALIAAVALADRVFGPSYFMTALFALTAGSIGYLSVFRLRQEIPHRRTDALMLTCVILQVLLYLVSDFTTDYTRFNLYFAVDLTLTLSLVALLPLTQREAQVK